MNIQKLLLLSAVLMAGVTMSAQRVFDANLYQGKAPHGNGDAKDTAKVRVFLPASKDATGKAIVICPGGKYETLHLDNEGYQWGEYFMNRGIAAIVLKYRMPHGNSDTPIADAENAIKMVRQNARAWNIKTNDVGVMGFSAGGHLASTIATQAKGDARPDFQVLFYPLITMMEGYSDGVSRANLLGNKPSKREEKKFSSDLNVSRNTPRAFIALCDDDEVVPPANGVNYYLELYRNDVPASLYVYPHGGHGWGSSIGFKHHLEMQLNLEGWLKSF